MVLERELIKLERFYAREITRVFDRAVSALNPSRKVNLTRAITRPAIKVKIQTATLDIFKQGIVSAEDEIKQALKRASAATIDTTLNDFESGIAKAYAEDTTEYMDFLSKDMQDQMNASLAEGHALGESIPKLSNRLEDTWKLGKVRAVRYARTQTNDVYNAAHMSRYSSSSVVEYVQFSAHLDDRTSPICRMYHKTIWRKDDPGVQVPPLHFNCFVEGTRIEPTGDCIAAFRAWYDGQVVELTLSDGRTLTITPNHMLFTPNGFLAAKFVRNGDDIICRPGFKGVVLGINPNDNHIQPTVEEEFSAISISSGMCSSSMPSTPADFHGDGEFVKDNIDVVAPNGFLLGDIKSTGNKHLSTNGFRSTDPSEVDFSSTRNLASMLISLANAADSRMSGIRKTSPFFSGRLTHPDIHCLATVPGSDSKLTQPRHNNTGSNTKLFGESLNRRPRPIQLLEGDEIDIYTTRGFKPHIMEPSIYSGNPNSETICKLLATNTGVIELQKVININIFPYHGYIYDFQTISTLCIGNGIVTSNCRSRLLPYFGKVPGERDYKVLSDGTEITGKEVKVIDKQLNTFKTKYWKSSGDKALADAIKANR